MAVLGFLYPGFTFVVEVSCLFERVVVDNFQLTPWHSFDYAQCQLVSLVVGTTCVSSRFRFCVGAKLLTLGKSAVVEGATWLGLMPCG